MEENLRKKIARNSAFFNGYNTVAAKYQRVRKWLCNDDLLIQSINDAEQRIENWTRNKKSLILNYESFMEVIDSYIYTIRFAVTHGINQARIDVMTEQKLDKKQKNMRQYEI